MKFHFVTTFLLLFFPLFAVSPQDEVELMEELISTTKKNLNGQEKLLEILQEFQKVRAAFIENPSSAKLATRLVRISANLKNKIEEEHVEHLFSNDLLTEVHFFAKVGQAQKVSRE